MPTERLQRLPPDQLAAALVANDIALTVSALYFADGYTLSYVPKTGGVATKVVQGAGISARRSDGTIASWARFGDVRGQVFTPGSTKLLSVRARGRVHRVQGALALLGAPGGEGGSAVALARDARVALPCWPETKWNRATSRSADGDLLGDGRLDHCEHERQTASPAETVIGRVNTATA